MQQAFRAKGCELDPGLKALLTEIFDRLDRFKIGADPLLRLHVIKHEHSTNGSCYTVHAHLTADGYDELYVQCTADNVIKAAHQVERVLREQLAKHVRKRANHRKGSNPH